MADTRTKKTPQWVGKAMLAIGIAVVVLSGCEIGLGEKVDVAAPTISLTSHQPGDFLKATAKLSGVAADDREIMTVQVALDRSGSFSDENVTVTKDGDSYTWTYTIDTTRRNDGPLYLTFQAVDTAGRAKKTDELRFDVDNSAPLVYLATPRNIAAAEGFNISEELEIQINDAYTPAFIAIQVYDGDGNNLVSKDRHSSIGGTEYAVESIGGNPSIVNYSAGTNWIFNFASADFYPADYDPEDYPNGFTFSIFVLSGDPAGNTSSYFYHIDDITKVGIEPGNLSSLRSRIADASTTPAKRENSSAKRLNLVFNEYLDIPWVRIGTLGHSAEDGRANINAVRNEEDLPYRIPAGGSLSIEARDDDLLAPGFPLLRIVDPETAVYDPSDDPEADKTRDQLVAEGWISLTPNSLNASPYSLDYSIPGDIGGTKWLYVLSRDNGGVQRLQRYDILLWRGDPELIIQTPEGGSGKGDIVFSGQATHPDADPVVELYRGGLGSGNLVLIDSATTQPLTGEDDPNWSFTVDSTEYTDGEYKFSIFAKIGGGDGAEEGVEGTKSREISLLIDNDAPQAPVYTGLTDGGVITSEEHTLTLVASDGAGSRVKAYEYRLSESDSWTTAERFGEIGEITLTGLQDSLNNTLYIRISDNVGNEAFDELDFSVSLSAPVFSVAGTWGVTSYRNTAEVVVSGSVTDSNGIAGVTASGAGAGTVVLDGSSGDTSRNWQVTLNPSAQGLNTLTLQTVDGAGITKTQEVSFTYDTLEPEMNVVNLEDGASISSPQYTITGTASDPSGLDTIEYSLNDGPAWDTWSPVDTLGQSWNHEVSGLSEGSAQQIRFRSRDKAGNTRLLDPITFGLDLNPPTLAVDTIAGVAFGDWNAGSALLEDFTITGSSTDANGIKSLEISMDGGVSFITLGDSPAEGASTNDTPVEFEQTVLISGDGSNDGLKAIIIRATDTYNKTSSRSFSVRFDASAPVVALSNLVDDQLITTSPFTLNGTWTDNGGSGTTGGQAKVEYSLDDATYAELTSGSSTFSGSIPFDEGLDQILYIRATDNVGNTNVTTVTGIDVDTALPNLAETSVNTTDIVLRNDGVTLGGTASDTLGLASVTISAEKDGTDQGVLPTDTDSPENWEYTLPAAGNDGLWVFTITAEDSAGRTRSLTRTVRLDSTPAVPSITAPGASEIVNGPTYTVAGTASDGGGSGVDEVRISFNADGSDSILVGGTSSWSANVTLSNYLSDEGPKTLYVQVLDNAGNLSPWNAVTQEFIYDTAKPSLTVDGSADRQEGGAFSLTGSTQDNYGVAAVDQWHITQEKDGGGVVTIDTGLPSTTGTDTNLTWELSNLPRDPADIGSQLVQDGEYVYTIRTEDLAGRGSDTRTITVVIDRTAPETLEITAPSSGQTGANALAGSAYTFRGSASDSGVGLEKIYYLISGASSAPTGTAGYTEIATSGTWSFTEDLDTDGLGADGGRAEGTWYLHVKAEDKAGNITADEDVVSVEFDIDQAAPSLTETGSGITGSAIAYRNADLTLSGTANDTNSLESVVVTYSKDGGASVELLNDTTDDGTWSTTLPVSAGDGAYEVTILATDEVGKTSSITRNIVIDTESPDLTLTAPVDGEFIDSGSYTIRGQVTDNGGKGVTSLEYSTDNATWTTIPLSGFNWSVTGVDFSTGGEGNRTLYVRATDGLNPESSQQVDFYYDTADPSLSEDNYSAAQEITNGDFTFTGDVSDSNALKDTGALVITASKDGGASSQVYSRSAAQIAADGGSYSYTVVLPDDGSDDGTWVYTITATDVAGRTKSETRTFLIDETDPDTPVIDAFAGAYQVNELVSSGTAADGGSGLQTVEYSFDQSNWSPASGTSSWFRTVDISMSAANVNHRLGQGNRTLYVRAIDRAGNVSPVGSRSFTVDRADPVVTVDAEYDGTVYKNAGFTVNGTVTDSLQLAGSPIAITVDGPNTDDIALGAFNYTSGDGSWSQAVPIDDGDGSYSIAITGSDNVGRTHTVTRTVVVDTADPVVAVNNLNGDGSTQVNGATYTVSGTVTESGSGIASVEYSLDTTDGLDGTWQAATGTTSW
ncbi:beta strand repeat-containing protein, partial [Spirochaeta lutea]